MVTTLGGWLSFTERKLIVPPEGIKNALHNLSKTEDFEVFKPSVNLTEDLLMNLPLSSLITLVYFNVIWQIMLWGYDLLHPVLGFMLVFFFPVIAGVAIYLVTYEKMAEGWVGPRACFHYPFPHIL